MSSQNIIWVSLDPLRNKIDFYPANIANKIEKAYNANEENVYLGSEFYCATVNFTENRNFQTTPGDSYIRSGSNFKQPGYRSVKRFVFTDEELKSKRHYISIMGKRIHGEWRITDSDTEYEKTYYEKIPASCIVKNDIVYNMPTFWTNDDLDSNDTNIVVWFWCKGVTNKQGNLFKLDDSWWMPYLQHQNEIIENGYSNNSDDVSITLPFDDSTRNIIFNKNSLYSKQIDPITHNMRLVKRLIITGSNLKKIFDKMNKLSIDLTIYNNINSSDETPIEFICPISQMIMIDPVKTTDNQTYDRGSIEKWFSIRHTSPLTGVFLNDTSLEANEELYNKIQNYIKANYES